MSAIALCVYDASMAVAVRLTTKEVCARLWFCRSTLWKKLKAGTFPAPIVAGTRHLWTEADISQWEDANRRQPNRQEAA